MKRFATPFLTAALAASGLLAQGQSPVLTTFPVGATTVSVSRLTSTNLNIVWELAWGADNFIWMTERYGRISRINPATGQVLPLLTLPDVTPTGESGLLGMALHPQFTSSPYVYIVYNYTDQGALKEKLVRYTYSAATSSLSSPLVLLGNIPATTTHSGSRLLILPDLTLLMTTGDAQLRPEAQNRASLNGKILRLNLDGTVPANNPTPGSLVYTLGHRNPQGLTLGPGGRIFSSEHGDTTEDEINLIEPDRNYGWPNVEGYCNLAAEATFCAANNVREPLTTWTPTIAPAALAYYNHPAIPGWQGSLLLAVLKGNRLTQLALNAAGTSISTRTDYLTTFGRLRAVCVSPQGRVYVGTSNTGSNTDRVLQLENLAYVPTTTTSAADFAFTLTPNPAQRQALLHLAPAQVGGQVIVEDLLGRTVLTAPATATDTRLDLSACRPGSYIVRVASAAGGTATRRLQVE